MSLLPVITISTESWHYRYVMWVRSFWGMDPRPKSIKACPYFQTIIWFTLGAVAASPLVILFYTIIKSIQGLFCFLDWMVGDGFALDSKYNPNAKLGRFDSFIDSVQNKLDEFLQFPILAKITGGLFMAMIGFFLVGFGITLYVVSFHLTHNTIPEIIKAIPYIPNYLEQFSLSVGDGIFRLMASIGEGLEDSGYAIFGMTRELSIWACHDIKYDSIACINQVERFYKNKPLWVQIGHWIGYTAGGGVFSLFVGYVGMEVLNSKIVTNYRADSAKRSAAKREVRNKRIAIAKELARNKRIQEIYDAFYLKRNMEASNCVEEPISSMQSGFIFVISEVIYNIFSKTEEVGGVAYKALGIFPLIVTMVVNGIKGTCPMIEFVSPEDMEAKRKKADDELVADIEKKRVEENKQDIFREVVYDAICRKRNMEASNCVEESTHSK